MQREPTGSAGLGLPHISPAHRTPLQIQVFPSRADRSVTFSWGEAAVSPGQVPTVHASAGGEARDRVPPSLPLLV